MIRESALNKSKKVILIFPSLRESSNDTSFVVGRLPFSLLYLERNLPEYDVEIYDERDAGFDLDRVLAHLDDVLCVGLSAFTGYQNHAALALSRRIRAANKRVPIVWGGWHPSIEPESTLREKSIDYLVLGQGEATFKELLQYL